MGKRKNTWTDDYVNETIKEIADERLFILHGEFEQGLKRCESPLEKVLLASMRRYLEMSFHVAIGPTRIATPVNAVWPEWPSPYHEIIIIPQSQIGNYRADFLVGVQSANGNFWIVVECDGHDFHEKTKEQARRDRARDRWMQMNGITVLRFTGSEIYEDPESCGDQVAECVLKKWMELPN